MCRDDVPDNLICKNFKAPIFRFGAFLRKKGSGEISEKSENVEEGGVLCS